jgi:hypothetical protein
MTGSVHGPAEAAGGTMATSHRPSGGEDDEWDGKDEHEQQVEWQVGSHGRMTGQVAACQTGNVDQNRGDFGSRDYFCTVSIVHWCRISNFCSFGFEYRMIVIVHTWKADFSKKNAERMRQCYRVTAQVRL